MALMMVLRVVCVFVGSRHERFRYFKFRPRAVLGYLRGALGGRGAGGAGAERHAGHNPGAAVAMLVMLVAVLGLAVTGVMLGRGDESVEGLHELLSYTLLA